MTSGCCVEKMCENQYGFELGEIPFYGNGVHCAWT